MEVNIPYMDPMGRVISFEGFPVKTYQKHHNNPVYFMILTLSLLEYYLGKTKAPCASEDIFKADFFYVKVKNLWSHFQTEIRSSLMVHFPACNASLEQLIV